MRKSLIALILLSCVTLKAQESQDLAKLHLLKKKEAVIRNKIIECYKEIDTIRRKIGILREQNGKNRQEIFAIEKKLYGNQRIERDVEEEAQLRVSNAVSGDNCGKVDLSTKPSLDQRGRLKDNKNNSVTKRTLVGSLPEPECEPKKEGIVVVAVKVNRKGEVVEAKVQLKGSTTMDKELWEKSVEVAKKAKFTVDKKGPAIQLNTITYHYESD